VGQGSGIVALMVSRGGLVPDAIVVEGLTKNYAEFVALHEVSFQVEAGTIFGLLGPNGAGKTTLVRILATVLNPSGGRAVILGNDVFRQPNRVRLDIGLAGQFAAVDEQLTGRENLRLVGRLAQLRPNLIPARADELLERFGLSDAANKPVKAYSGGMRRRLDIASALVQRPRVLFLDEPTTGLDLQSRGALWSMIRELVRGGTTVLLTTQYLEEADQLADRIAVINFGEMIANDTPARLKAVFGSTILELSYPDAETASRAAEMLANGQADRLELDRAILRLRTQDSAQVLSDVLPRLEQAGLRPSHLLVRDPSMDDVFLALTGRPDPDTQSAVGAVARPRRGRE
jgi:ABC-2 type transport system ATP-binding protein